jgi:chromosome segregation ATPase
MARLVYLDPTGRQQQLLLGPEHPQVVIGRHPECDLVSSDTSVSRRHCIISWEDGHFRVADLGAANGTQVNDQRVTRRHLVHRDVVRCGNLVVQFLDDGGPTPQRGRGFSGSEVVATQVARNPLPQVPPGLSAAPTPIAPAPLPSRAEALQAQLTRLEEFNRQQATRLGVLQTELADAERRVERALGQLADLENENRELRATAWRIEEAARARDAEDPEAADDGDRNETIAFRLPADVGGAEVADTLAALAVAEAARAQAEAARDEALHERDAGARALAEAKDRAAAEAQGRADLESRARAAEQTQRNVEARLKDTETRLKLSETRARTAETNGRSLQARAQAAEDAARELETRSLGLEAKLQAADALERRATEAEARAEDFERRATEAEARAEQAEARAAEVEARAEAVEGRAGEVERRAEEMERQVAEARAAAASAVPTVDPGAVEALANERDALVERLSAAEQALDRMRNDRVTASSTRLAETASLRGRISELEALVTPAPDTTTGENEAELVAGLEAERGRVRELERALAASREDVEAERLVAIAAGRRSTDDAADVRDRALRLQVDLDKLRAELDVQRRIAQEANSDADQVRALLDALESSRARGERAFREQRDELDRLRASLEKAEAELAAVTETPVPFESISLVPDVSIELEEAESRANTAERALESVRRDEAHLRSALAEAREEAKAAGALRRQLRELQQAQSALEARLAESHATTSTPEPDPAVVELERAERRALEQRLRATELALGEAEGRAQEAQSALLQVREAEKSARLGRPGSGDSEADERMRQLSVKLAAVTRRAQQLEELTSQSRRSEERVRQLEQELAALRSTYEEADSERERAAQATLELLVERKRIDAEMEASRRRIEALEGRVTPTWPAGAEANAEVLTALVQQLRTTLTGVIDTAPGPELNAALESARQDVDGLGLAADGVRESLDAVRKALTPAP